jgi:glucose/arabinose dehydrogenase/cytochrome c2
MSWRLSRNFREKPSGPALRRFGKLILAFALGSLFAYALALGFDHARGRTADDGIWVEEVVRGLNFPSAVVWLPNGDMLISERQGGIRRVSNGMLSSSLLKGVPPSFQTLLEGIKDITLDPDFQANNELYLLITEGTYDHHSVAVYRGVLAGDELRNVERIFRSVDEPGGPGSMSGRLAFLADKTLLVGTASGGTRDSQRMGSHLGKVLRINREGGAPADNPFLNRNGALPEIWSYGHRNPRGLFFDRVDGTVWEVEPGARGGDEINVVKRGANYGWPLTTWSFNYSGEPISAKQSDPGMEDALWVWTPSVSPAGITRYHGSLYPAWKGDLFVATLNGRALERLRFSGHQLIAQERLLVGLDERIRDVRVGPDGYLYVLTDHSNGRLLRLRPGKPAQRDLKHVARKLETSAFDLPGDQFPIGDPVRGRSAFLQACSSCHSAGTDAPGGQIGPKLEQVYGRKAGMDPSYSYSVPMRNASHVWDFFNLHLMMADPNKFIPGTTMSAPPLQNREMRADIVAYLMSRANAAGGANAKRRVEIGRRFAPSLQQRQ